LNLRSLFKRKKKKKKEDENEPATTIFGEPIVEENSPTVREKVKGRLQTFRSRSYLKGKPSPPKVEIGVLRPLKRLLAIILCFIYASVTVFVFPNLLSLVFLGTALLLFDYLRNTRRMKWREPDE